jgi:hypothetical protein
MIYPNNDNKNKDGSNNGSNDGVPSPLPPAGTVSEQYILDELAKSKISLNRTRIFSIIALVVTAAYMGFITVNLGQFLRPAQAAELAQGLIAQKVQEQGPDIAAQFKQQVPILIAQAPDYAMQQLPVYRQNLEDQFDKDLTTNLASGSVQLDKNLDDYMTTHKDEVKSVLVAGADPAAVKQLGDGVTQEFLGSLKTTQINGESIQSKFDSSLEALTAVQKKMDRLANNSNLTPQEKKTRHAIAIMTKTINRHMPALHLPVAVAATQ